MNISSADDERLVLFRCSDTGIEYTLTSRILCAPDFPPCPSYTLTIKDRSQIAVLDDLTIHRDRALRVFQSFLTGELLPIHAPFVAEDLLADELFVW